MHRLRTSRVHDGGQGALFNGVALLRRVTGDAISRRRCDLSMSMVGREIMKFVKILRQAQIQARDNYGGPRLR